MDIELGEPTVPGEMSVFLRRGNGRDDSCWVLIDKVK